MNTTELFDFSFVDREREQIIFNNFILESPKTVLWIDGKRGVGKTQFVTYMVEQNVNFLYAYYDIKEDRKNEEILIEFIKMLQNLVSFDFCEFVRKEYKSFYDSLGSTIKDFSKSITNNISSITPILLDITNYVITKSNERRENVDIIRNYIEKILENKKLFICVDNFSRCNKDIVSIFCNIFMPFLERANCRICIITTTEDMDDEKRIRIRESVPNRIISIGRFKDQKYFYQIMNPIFEMNDFTEDEVEYIYHKCNGKPQKLSVIISKLLDRQGILYDSGRKKASINKKILQSILREEYINYDANDFNSVQKWIIFSFLCLYEGAYIHDVKELAMYIAERNLLFSGFTETKFNEELLTLIEHNKLCSDGNILETCHDSDYIDFMDIFATSGIYSIFSQISYEFLLTNNSLHIREDLICRHMREAQINAWEERNYLYGEKLFQQHQYYDAQKIFAYLLKEENFLNNKQLLLISINEYEVGHFESTINLMKKISINDLVDTVDKYNLVFYWGKSIYNYTGDISKAIEKLQEAKTYVSQNSKEYVKVQNLLQMYYIEVPGKQKCAFEIFNEIRCKFKNLYPDAWASTMRGCHNFLHNNDEALELLDEAINCTDDEIEHAYIETTKGFIYARKGNISTAKCCFENSYEKIKLMKHHESSYAANNLAVCYMIEGNYVMAREILQDALFWNKTNYCKIVLNVHLMLCEAFLKNKNDAEKYLNILQEYIDIAKPKDEVILRKVYLNLAVVSKQIDHEISFQKYIPKASKYVHGTSSEWRFSVIQQSTNGPQPKNLYYGFSLFDPWFLVYAHD